MSLVAALALTIFFAVPSVEQARGAVQRVLEENDLQTQRHRPPDPTGRTAPRRGARGGGPPTAEVDPPDSGGLAPLLRALLWTGIVVFALLVVAAVVTAWRDREGVPEARPPPAAAPAASPTPDLAAPLDAATALAAEGRYGEAAHVLLLKTLGRLASVDHIPPSWTSREILARIELEPEASRALEDLVETTELSLFGGREVDADAYRACRASFERFRETVGA